MNYLEFKKCYYSPAFFRMKIDVPVPMDSLLDITDGTFSLYLHEYIHFLQDISTIYGLMNISTISYYIQDVTYRISKSGMANFDVPVPLVNDGRDFGFRNFKLLPIYIGTAINPKRKTIQIIGYQKNKHLWGDAPSEVIDVILVTAINADSGEEFQFQLGGNHITEGMAYLSERMVFQEILKDQGVEIPADDYPYTVALKLAQMIYPELASDELLVIATCDASLMTYHPGLSFIRLLEYFKAVSFIGKITSIDDLYIEAATFLKGTHESFETILETVRSQLKNNFKIDEFQGNNIWIDNVLDKIKKIRVSIPSYITDVLQLGNPKTNILFGRLHQAIGSPLVLNGEDNATISLPTNFIPDNFHVSLFWAVNQVLKVFTNNNALPCEMKEYCKNSSKVDPQIIVDDRCDTAPWSRCRDANLCPFAVIWKHWGLSPHYPSSTAKIFNS